MSFHFKITEDLIDTPNKSIAGRILTKLVEGFLDMAELSVIENTLNSTIDINIDDTIDNPYALEVHVDSNMFVTYTCKKI